MNTGLHVDPAWIRHAVAAGGGEILRIARAYDMALSLMGEHGVSDWELRIGGSKDTPGKITYTTRNRRWNGEPGVIVLSGPLMSLWDEPQQRDTILHEIAHALVPDAKHDCGWQRVCVRIGANPTPLWGEDGEARIPREWHGKCPGGHRHTPRRRMPRTSWACGKCSPVYDPRYVVTWTRQENQ